MGQKRTDIGQTSPCPYTALTAVSANLLFQIQSRGPQPLGGGPVPGCGASAAGA